MNILINKDKGKSLFRREKLGAGNGRINDFSVIVRMRRVNLLTVNRFRPDWRRAHMEKVFKCLLNAKMAQLFLHREILLAAVEPTWG